MKVIVINKSFDEDSLSLICENIKRFIKVNYSYHLQAKSLVSDFSCRPLGDKVCRLLYAVCGHYDQKFNPNEINISSMVDIVLKTENEIVVVVVHYKNDEFIQFLHQLNKEPELFTNSFAFEESSMYRKVVCFDTKTGVYKFFETEKEKELKQLKLNFKQ